MRSKIDPETMQIQAPGAVLEPSGDPLGGLGVSGGASGDFCCDLVEIFGEVGAKMGPRWTQDGPSWQQVAPKMGHDGAKMAILGSVWQLLGGSWEHFWLLFLRSLEKWLKCKNDQHSITFGSAPEGPGGCLGRVLGAMLEEVGSKMVFFGLSWEMLWHLGAKMAHRSAKTRQDRRT